MNIYAEQYLGRKAHTYYDEIQYYYKHKMSALSKMRVGKTWKKLAKDISTSFEELEHIKNEWVLISKLEDIKSKCEKMRNDISYMRQLACIRDFYALLFRRYYWSLSNNLQTIIMDRREELDRQKDLVIKQISLGFPKRYTRKIHHIA